MGRRERVRKGDQKGKRVMEKGRKGEEEQKQLGKQKE